MEAVTNSMIGFLRRNSVSGEFEKTALYVPLLRLILEHGWTVWNPYINDPIDRL